MTGKVMILISLWTLPSGDAGVGSCPPPHISGEVGGTRYRDHRELREMAEDLCHRKFSEGHCPWEIVIFPSGHIHVQCKLLGGE